MCGTWEAVCRATKNIICAQFARGIPAECSQSKIVCGFGRGWIILLGFAISWPLLINLFVKPTSIGSGQMSPKWSSVKLWIDGWNVGPPNVLCGKSGIEPPPPLVWLVLLWVPSNLITKEAQNDRWQDRPKNFFFAEKNRTYTFASWDGTDVLNFDCELLS